MTTKELTQQVAEKIQRGAPEADEELATLAQMAEIQGEQIEGERIVNTPGADVPFPMMTTKTEGPGLVWLRHNQTGKLKQVNKLSLFRLLQLRLDPADARKAGLPAQSKAWLPPSAPWKGKVKVGTVLCRLHQDHPDRPLMDEFNLEVCFKPAFLNSRFANLHLKKKHREAYETLEERRKEDAESRMEARYAALTRAVTKSAGGRGRKKKAA